MSIRNLALLGSMVGLLIFFKTFAQDFKEMTLTVDTPKGKREVYFSISHEPGTNIYEATLNPEGGSGFLGLGSNALSVRITSSMPPTNQELVEAFSATSDYREGRKDDSISYREWLGALSVINDHQKYGTLGEAFDKAFKGWSERVAVEQDLAATQKAIDEVSKMKKEDKKRETELRSRYVGLAREYDLLCERPGRKEMDFCKRREAELKALNDQITALGVSLDGDVVTLQGEKSLLESIRTDNRLREKSGRKLAVAYNASASSRIDVSKINCCGSGGDSKLNAIVPGYCDKAKATSEGSLSVEGFGSVALTDVCLDGDAKQKSKLCINDQAKCMYVDSGNELFIPFTGKLICTVKQDQACTDNPTKCAQQQQEVYSEHFGRGEPDIERQLRQRFKGEVQAPGALEGR